MTRFIPCTTALALTALLLPAAHAATGTRAGHLAEIEATYRSERQTCLDGRSGQDRASCLSEAGAARQQARSDRLDNGETAAQLARNAGLRCDAQPLADQPDCLRLAHGEGQRSGSTAGGGVMKQITTLVTGPLPLPAGPAASAAAR